MINIIFAVIFAIGFMMASFLLGALWCMAWYDKEKPKEEQKMYFDDVLKKSNKKESCAMYDESCEHNNCNLCIMYEEEKND